MKQQNNTIITNFTHDQLLTMNITQAPFLLDPILPKVGVAMLYGPSDAGKSFFCKQLSVSIANGDADFLGFPLQAAHKKVLYLLTEEIDIASLSMKAKMQNKSITCNNPGGITYVIGLNDQLSLLETELSKNQYDLIIIDGWADTVKGDINQLNVTRANTLLYRKLAIENNCSILLLHHANKSGEDNSPNKKYLSGSQAIEASVRSLFELRKLIGNQKSLSIVKGNDFSDDYKDGYYLLETDDNMTYASLGFQSRNFISGKPKKEKFFDNQELCKKAMELRRQGLTYEQIQEYLEKEFTENAPKLTTIKNWFNDTGNKLLESAA